MRSLCASRRWLSYREPGDAEREGGTGPELGSAGPFCLSPKGQTQGCLPRHNCRVAYGRVSMNLAYIMSIKYTVESGKRVRVCKAFCALDTR